MHTRTHTHARAHLVCFLSEKLKYLLKSKCIKFKIIVVFFSINNKILFIRSILIRISVNRQPVNCQLLGRTLDVLLDPYKFLFWKNVFSMQLSM